MKQILIAALLLTCFAACELEPPELPPETQTGENTFGCLVNGELVVPYYRGDDNPRVVYDRTADRLRITGYGQNNQFFRFTVDHPEANRTTSIDTVEYYPQQHSYGRYYYGGTHLGEITLTRLDLTKGIVSGIFNFVGYKHYTDDEGTIDQNDIVTVTMGRFDIRLYY